MSSVKQNARHVAGESPLKPGHQPQAFKGQKLAILQLLREHRGHEVPASRLAEIGLQFQTRVFELRAEGFTITNRMERKNGRIFSFYVLACEPGEDPQSKLFEGAQ